MLADTLSRLPKQMMGSNMRARIIHKRHWPDVLKLPIVKGVCVGGCIDPEDEAFNGSLFAHAHIKDDPIPGWICFKSRYLLLPKFECLHLHELAHLVSGIGHNERFRRALLSIGGRLDGCYVWHRGRRIHFANDYPNGRKT
jgi:hypothetical protein